MDGLGTFQGIVYDIDLMPLIVPFLWQCLISIGILQITYTSDYFQDLYDLAVELIRRGQAYVDHQVANYKLYLNLVVLICYN